MTPDVQAEYDRIKNGPQTGLFSFLHHETICENSDNVMQRIGSILREKSNEEHLTRLHCIYPLPEFQPRWNALNAEILEFLKTKIPNFSWNGQSIL